MDLLDLKNLILLPAVIGWLMLRKPRPQWLKLLGVLLFCMLATEAIALWLKYSLIYNCAVYNVFVHLDFILSHLILAFLNPNPRSSKIFLGIFTPFFITVAAFEWMKVDFFSTYYLPLILFTGLTIAIHSLIVVTKMSFASAIELWKRGSFWVLLSFLFYYAVFVPSLGLAVYFLDASNDLASKLFAFNEVLFMIRFTLLTVAFIILYRQPRYAQ